MSRDAIGAAGGAARLDVAVADGREGREAPVQADDVPVRWARTHARTPAGYRASTRHDRWVLRQIQRNHGFNVCGLRGRRLAARHGWGWRRRFECITAGGAMPIIGPTGIHSRRSDAKNRMMARLMRFGEAEAPQGGGRSARTASSPGGRRSA